jgi:hypothetical protein
MESGGREGALSGGLYALSAVQEKQGCHAQLGVQTAMQRGPSSGPDVPHLNLIRH